MLINHGSLSMFFKLTLDEMFKSHFPCHISNLLCLTSSPFLVSSQSIYDAVAFSFTLQTSVPSALNLVDIVM